MWWVSEWSKVWHYDSNEKSQKVLLVSTKFNAICLIYWFYFYLGLPILGRVSAIARHATMWARNSPSPSSMRHRPPHRDWVPYSLQTVCRFFNVPQNCLNLQGFWDGTYGLLSLSEKTRKSNCFQMSLQRQHFPLRYLKTLSVGSTGVGTNGLPLGRLALIQLS